MKRTIIASLFSFLCSTSSYAQVCPYDSRCLNNPYGAGSRYAPNGVNNSYSSSGSRYSNESANNPYATNAPQLYDQGGNYRGRLSENRNDPDSTSNSYGRYGSRYSSDSINNPYANHGPVTVVPTSPN